MANKNPALMSHINNINFCFLKNERFNEHLTDANLFAYVADAFELSVIRFHVCFHVCLRPDCNLYSQIRNMHSLISTLVSRKYIWKKVMNTVRVSNSLDPY